MKSPYKILGVSPEADESQIKKAFRMKARQIHPDKTGKKSDKEFAELSNAYAIIANPERRKKFDESGEDYHNKTFEEKVHEEVKALIVIALEQSDFENRDLFKSLKKCVQIQIQKERDSKLDKEKRKLKFENLSKRVSKKNSSPNAATIAISEQINMAQKAMDAHDQTILLMFGVIKELDLYQWEFEEKETNGQTTDLLGELRSKFKIKISK